MSLDQFPEQIVKDFLCLRTHGEHAWGLQVITINGKKGYAIVTTGDDEEHHTVFAIIWPLPVDCEVLNMFGRPMVGDQIPAGPVKVTN